MMNYRRVDRNMPLEYGMIIEYQTQDVCSRRKYININLERGREREKKDLTTLIEKIQINAITLVIYF